jgi:hypothetical protein
LRTVEHRRFDQGLVGIALTLLVVALSRPAVAFPGVLVAKDDAERRVRATVVVLMQHQGISIVTLMAEYEGPLTPFAFVLPVPADVRASEVRTVRRGVLARVEAISAPRFHAFYEQDPCASGDTEQSWDEHVKVRGPGFLAPPGLPPRDRHYAVPNDISVPVEAVFKDRENEFRYSELRATDPDTLAAELGRGGYRVGPQALAALASATGAGQKLLLAEVSPERAELAGGARVALGGIRYWSRRSTSVLRESLGGANGGAPEDLLLYALDRERRQAVKGRENAFLPLSVAVERRAAERLASVYAGLFDAFTTRHPQAFVTEFAWSTRGCGEPCPDAPLAPDELMTLGGEVLEAHTTSAVERAPVPADEPILERERFESHLAELAPNERPRARREHARDRREVERRRALTARQSYVLTRIHRRYADGAAREDLTLAPAPPLSGGVGVPRGAAGELPAAAVPAAENRLEVRFFALEPWARGSECSEPRRFRWGKRWASEARAPRAVPLALDLAGALRDPRLLREVLRRPLPELGITELTGAGTPAVPAPSGSASSAASAHVAPSRGCGLTRRPFCCGHAFAPSLALPLLFAALAHARLRRRRGAKRR